MSRSTTETQLKGVQSVLEKIARELLESPNATTARLLAAEAGQAARHLSEAIHEVHRHWERK